LGKRARRDQERRIGHCCKQHRYISRCVVHLDRFPSALPTAAVSR
jgi:hypothetical protein